MNKLFYLAIWVLVGTLSVFGQKQKQDQQAIKDMCGCYEVEFNFAETFKYSKDSANYVPSKIKHDKALEWVELVSDKDNEIVLQHLLIVGSKEKPHIVKHWRQDWLYENTDFYMYNANNQWKYQRKSPQEVKGQWTQKVYQVDDSPRYEGSGTWVFIDGKKYWENTTTAPLPRREYTTRHDYNLTLRGNRQEITNFGWIHDQDNKKIIRKAGEEDFVLAEEKGYNVYKKVDNTKCKAAQDWWKTNKDLWGKIRENWDKVFARKQDLTLKHKVDDKRLYEYLFGLKTDATDKEINKIITDFVE